MSLQRSASCLIFGLAAGIMGLTLGATFYVDVDHGGHNTPFSTPADAATNIQSAVALAVNDDTILIAPGTYTVGPFAQDQDSVVRLFNQALTLRGTGANPAQVRIDGEGTHRGIFYDRTSADGSALRILTIENLTVTNGYHASQGSGIWLRSVRNTTKRLIDSIVEGCTGAGEALRHYDVTNADTRLEVENSIFRYNQTGNAFYSYRIGTFDVRDSQVENNDGRGMYLIAGSGQIVNTLVLDNHAGDNGGGIYLNVSGDVTLRNCLIADNTCQVSGTRGGGGVFKQNIGGVLVQNCTIVNNVAIGLYGDGGIHRDTRLNGSVDLINTILWNNRRDEGTVINYNWWDANMTIRSMTNSISTPIALFPDSGNLNADPLFVGAGSGNYRLRRDSPAVGAGLYQPWMDDAVDLDENPRINRITDAVDIGAYAYQYPGTILLVR